MAKCQKCNGKGIMTVHNVGTDENFRTECDICHGTGEAQPITNEEFLRMATTEQLAEILTDIQTDGYYKTDCMNYEERLAWLKEKHDEMP